MRTLRLRIIVTFALAFLGVAFAMWIISAQIARTATRDFFEGSMALEVQQAENAYEAGGAKALGEYLASVDQVLKGKRFLTDSGGRDLISGADRSQTAPGGFNFLGFPRNPEQFMIAKTSADGRYRLLVMAPPPLGLVRFAPYFVLLALAILLLGWLLSTGIISPLHRLSRAVDAFGRGDLSARVKSNRRDEIGDLARSFNSMASRIETLLTAERRLLQDVSHELRSPLARLCFAAELVRNTSDPDAAIARLHREIQRLSGLVSTLLEVTGSEGDPASRRTEEVLLASLVDEVVEDCRLEAEARHVLVKLQNNCATAILQGTPELLRRAMENVLRNAIRFAPSESAILVSLEALDHTLSLSIRDLGPGVPDTLLERIFDPFFRVDESRDGMAGVGLGLSIARRAILLHGGNIRAENTHPGLLITICVPYATPPSSSVLRNAPAASR